MKIRMLKRFAAALTAASITSVSLAMSTICPVFAVGGFAWLEWAELESLLQGIGFTSGNESLTDATIDYLEMTYDQIYQLTDPTGGGTAKPIWEQSWWDDSIAYLDHLVASWDETYDTIDSVGSFSVSPLPSPWSVISAGISTDGQVLQLDASLSKCSYPSSSTYPYVSLCKYYTIPSGYLYYVVNINGNYKLLERQLSTNNIIDYVYPYHFFVIQGSNYSAIQSSYSIFNTASPPSDISRYGSVADIVRLFDSFYVTTQFDSFSSARNHILSSSYHDPDPTLSTFVGPVYSYPAAEQLAKDNDTLSGIRLDVKTADGVPDLQAALDGAGVDSVDDLVVGVADGSIPMQQVFADAKVTPYVLADTTTGAVVTDLGVAATGTAVKPVALTADLAVPSDLTAAATYAIQGKTWDPDMSKYKLPLFQYFPFCLPWDIYQVLSSFAADPVAPVITIPIGKFFANKKNIDGSAVKDYTVTVDLGEDKYSKWFSYLRLLESAGIIIGLVLISVKLIHGGR